MNDIQNSASLETRVRRLEELVAILIKKSDSDDEALLHTLGISTDDETGDRNKNDATSAPVGS